MARAYGRATTIEFPTSLDKPRSPPGRTSGYATSPWSRGRGAESRERAGQTGRQRDGRTAGRTDSGIAARTAARTAPHRGQHHAHSTPCKSEQLSEPPQSGTLRPAAAGALQDPAGREGRHTPTPLDSPCSAGQREPARTDRHAQSLQPGAQQFYSLTVWPQPAAAVSFTQARTPPRACRAWQLCSPVQLMLPAGSRCLTGSRGARLRLHPHSRGPPAACSAHAEGAAAKDGLQPVGRIPCTVVFLAPRCS